MEASEVLEISKENIQPLKQGRKTSVLGTAIQARTNEDFHHELLKKRDQFEVGIRSYEGDDPLKVWHEYMLWIEQNFPTDGRHGNLHVLLERCLTEFKDVKMYNQDVRFIAMWIKYLNNISNSLEMYKQVHAYGIGTECAIFYINWAEELEENHDWKRADQVYVEGIQSKAEPVDDLVSAHNNFQLRVARHCLEDQEHVSTPTDEMNQRSVLTRLKPHGRKHLVNNVRVGTSIQQVTPGVLRSLDYNGVGNNNKPSGGIKIFTNENADVNDVSLNHVVKPNNPMQYREQIIKENTKKAGRWNEGKFKQNHNPAVNHQPSFEVHEDDQSAIPISQPCTNITINALKQRRFASEENSIPVALFEPPDPTKKPMYPKHKVYTGGTEFSLEELYAIKYKERYSRKLQEQRASQRIATEELALDSAVPSEGRKMHYYSIDEDKNATKMGAEKANTLDEDKLEQKVLQSSNQEPSIEVFVDKHCENPSNHHTRVVYDDEESVPVALFEPPDPMKRPMYPKDKDHLEACRFFETSGGLNRTEQSFTINTKEAMNAVQGLFTSPQVGRHITDPVIHKSVPVFTIHMDESVAEEKNCHIPDTHQGEIQKKTAPCDDAEEEPISRVNVYRQPIQGIRKSNFIQQTQSNFLLPEEHNHQETNFTVYRQDDELENVFPNAFGQENETGKCGEPFKMPDIPYVASPGMTKKELLALNDTENNENSTNASVHKGKGTNCKDTFRILQPSQHIPFLPWEDLQVAKTERDDDLGVQPLYPLSDETCTTQIFSDLISSTPFEKHARQSPVQILKNEGGQHMDESYCPRDVTKKIGDKCNSENKSNINSCHYPSLVSLPSYSSGKQLSAIIETSNEKSSGSSGSSGVTSRRLTYHWATQENLKVIEECSLQPDDRCSPASTGDIRHVEDEVQETCTYPFPEKFLSELLAKVGFPSTNYKGSYFTLPMRLPCKKKLLNLGNDEYLCSESLVDQRHLDAVEMKSGQKVSLKIQQSICPWEYYIMEEIPLRLKDPDLALYYMSIEKAYSLEKSCITVSEYSPYCDLQSVVTNAHSSMAKIPTLIAKYWTYEMLEIMKHLHKCGIIHGDLRLENFLVQDISGTAPSLKLLNFDRAIDMTLFPVGTTFSIFDTSQEERYPFLKILHKQHWSYQIDFIKVASSAYTINFCVDLDVIEKDGNWVCQQRLLQHPWKSFFFQLLNVKSSEEFPNVTALQNEIMENVDQELIISEFKNFEYLTK